ncbi:MAG: hypothetical protein ACKOAL_12545 [Chthoniobacterales bacterium]
MLRYLWLIALVALVAGLVGFHLFTNWRARDLATKAQENFREGNYRMAWLQMQSARELRPEDVEVLRAGALLEAKFGQPDALATMQDLEKKTALGAEEIKEKANAAARFGSEEEFENAVKKLEAMGTGDAYSLRAARAELRGDLDRAIVEARRAIEASNRPEAKLDLARALGKRHGYSLRLLGQPAPEDVPALREVVQIIDSLQSGKLAEPALALGLTTAAADVETKKRWAEAGMENVSPANPALLPAAEFLAQSGAIPAQDLRDRLRPIYDSATLAQRADFALWLARQGMPKEAVSMVTAQEAADDMSAFLARTDGLARLANWRGILEAATDAEKVPDSIRHLTRAWAVMNLEDETGKQRALAAAVEAAVQSAGREKQLGSMMVSLDSIGAGPIAEAELVRLCSAPATTDAAFSLLRERIGKTKGTAALETVYQSAKAAAPTAPSVADHGRYLELFRGLQIKEADTAAAIAGQPSEISPRITHALLMLRANNPAAAKAAFDDITVFYDQMIPAHQVVVAAFTAGNGNREKAQGMRREIKRDVLTPGEKKLLDQWVPEGAPMPSP